MLEREAELEALEAAISAGSGRVLILEGAAGVGKSALLDVAREMAGQCGHQVLHARGSERYAGTGHTARPSGTPIVSSLCAPCS